jgi:hypothetical protein
MDAHAVPLLAILEKKMRVEVPLFQRQYVWNQEHQWEPLWEDISRKFLEALDGRQDAPVHFLGRVEQELVVIGLSVARAVGRYGEDGDDVLHCPIVKFTFPIRAACRATRLLDKMAESMQPMCCTR